MRADDWRSTWVKLGGINHRLWRSSISREVAATIEKAK
jgi:hypothetical protein